MIRNIVLKKLKDIKKQFNLSKDVIKLSKMEIEYILNESKYEEYGARKVDKLVKEKIKKVPKITIETT